MVKQSFLLSPNNSATNMPLDISRQRVRPIKVSAQLIWVGFKDGLDGRKAQKSPLKLCQTIGISIGFGM